MRLFLAVELDAAARRDVAAIARDARAACGPQEQALRWAADENIHVTLHFLGTVDDTRAGALIATLGAGMPDRSFTVETGHVGTFPHRGPVRTVWLSIEQGRDALTRLHDALASRLIVAGFTPESRPFTPHVTLARARDRDRHTTRHLARDLTAVEPRPIRWTVREVVLLSSDLSGARPRYRPVHALPLQGSQ